MKKVYSVLVVVQKDKFSFEGSSACGIGEEQRGNQKPLGFYTELRKTVFIYHM